jgi:hypothetical protein
MAGALVRALAAALAITAAATLFVGGIERPLVAAASLVLTALVFAALGVIVGVWADTFDQHSFVTAVVVTPLASSAASSTPRAHSMSHGRPSPSSTRSTTSSTPASTVSSPTARRPHQLSTRPRSNAATRRSIPPRRRSRVCLARAPSIAATRGVRASTSA